MKKLMQSFEHYFQKITPIWEKKTFSDRLLAEKSRLRPRIRLNSYYKFRFGAAFET